MYYYNDNHSMYIESKKEYTHCGWLTVSECEKMDISVFKAEEKIFSMSFSDIMNGRYSYEITPYEDVKISGVEFPKTKIAIIADVLKDRDNNYDFYISGKCLIVKNQYGIGIIRGLKRNG